MIAPIPFVTPTKPTFATLPFIGIQPALMDAEGKRYMVIMYKEGSVSSILGRLWPEPFGGTTNAILTPIF